MNIIYLMKLFPIYFKMPGEKIGNGIVIHDINIYGCHKLGIKRFKDKNVNKIEV